LGVHESSISLAPSRIAPLRARQGITITPSGTRISALGALRDHAAAAGITIPEPQPQTPPQSTLQTPTHRKFTLFRDPSREYRSLRDHGTRAMWVRSRRNANARAEPDWGLGARA